MTIASDKRSMFMKWAEDNDFLSDAQFGFRKNRSTVDAIFVLNAIINKMLNEERR